MRHAYRAIMFVLLLLLTLLRPVITEAQEQRKNIAILDAILLDNSPSWNRAVQRGMTDTIIGYFVREGSYTVLDRGSYQQIATELEFQSRGFVDDAQVQQFGRQSGAEYIVVIRVGEPARDRFIVTASIMHVETGAVVDQVSEMRSGTVDVLFDLAHVVGAELTGTTAAITKQPQSLRSGDRQSGIFSGLTYDLGLLYGIGGTYVDALYDTTSWAFRFIVQNGRFAIRPTLGFSSYDFLDDSNSSKDRQSFTFNLPITVDITENIPLYVGLYGGASVWGFRAGVNAGLNFIFNRFIVGIDYMYGQYPASNAMEDATEIQIGLFSGWRF